MAKKKTKNEVATVTEAGVEETKPEVVESEENSVEAEATDGAGNAVMDEGVSADAQSAEAESQSAEAESQSAESEASVEDVSEGECGAQEAEPAPEAAATESAASLEDNALHVTGEVHLDEEFNDAHALTRLRGGQLSASELYREAQLFASHNFDVDALLRSLEMPLVQNVEGILNIRDEFYAAELELLSIDDAELQEQVIRNVISKVRREIASYLEVSELICAIASEGRLAGAYLAFVEKFIGALRAMIVKQSPDMTSQMNALTRVCNYIPDALMSRILFDPSPLIRAAVIRSFPSRSGVNMNDLTVILIMLKDRNEGVDIAIMRMLSKFVPFADLAVPPVLESLSTASDALRSEIYDVFRSYGNEAVAPVMMGLEDMRDTIYVAVRDVIAQAPQRYTDALLERLESIRTRDYVRERVADILIAHKDDNRRAEIASALKRYKSQALGEKPEWVPPETGSPKFATPATEDRSIYERLLSEDELDAFSKNCTHDMLIQLLNDASETTRINALHLIRHRGEADQDVREVARIWLKTMSVPLAMAAFEAYLAVEPDLNVAMDAVANVLVSCPSDDVKDMIFEELSKRQDKVNGIIEAFYEVPRKRAVFVHRLLRQKPSEETFKRVLGGLSRERSVACIYETLSVLLKTGYIFDNMPLRPVLIDLIEKPVSKGQFGLMTRILSMRLLRRYMLDQSDPETVSALQRIYKENHNFEIRELAKDLLRAVGEEIFDLDDEFDDFEDLNDDEDED